MNFAPQTPHSSDCGMVGTFPGCDCLVRVDFFGLEEPPTMCSGEGMERERMRGSELVQRMGRHRGGRLVIALCSGRT